MNLLFFDQGVSGIHEANKNHTPIRIWVDSSKVNSARSEALTGSRQIPVSLGVDQFDGFFRVTESRVKRRTFESLLLGSFALFRCSSHGICNSQRSLLSTLSPRQDLRTASDVATLGHSPGRHFKVSSMSCFARRQL